MAENTNPAAATAVDPAATAENADAKGLLDAAKPTKVDAPNPDPAASNVSHLADDPTKVAQDKAAEKRERPAYVPEKFWNKEKSELLTESAMKAYADLEKQFKLGNHKPPLDGKYDLTPLADKIPADDPLLTAYTGWAAKHGLSQAAFDELATQVVDMANGSAKEFQVSQKAEMEQLGEQGPALVDSMVEWAQGFVSSGVWTAEDFDEFKIMGGTAKGLRALVRLRESYEGRVPLRDTTPSDIGLSDEELKARVGHPDYQTNKGGYRDTTERLFEKRYGGQRAA